MNEQAAAADDKALPEDIVLKWWAELADKRGDRAELRRARSLSEVIFSAAFQRLWQRLRGSGWNRADGVALLAAVLSQAESHDPAANFAAQLARSGAGDKPRYSGLRFRRLLQYRVPEELAEPMIRALRMVDRKGNLRDLASSLYRWSDKTRRQWAFDYYGANPNAE
jgi:CRISPR system Cascade subunit CasB